MTGFTIKIAERVIEARTLFESTRDFCREYLWEGKPDFTVETSQEDIAFEREKSAREDVIEGIPVRNFSDAYLETIALQRRITEALFAYDVLLFHGSAVAVDGQAFLFTAKSGTGKSTHTRLWRQLLGDRAIMVNDDKPFLHCSEAGITVYGTPWNGKHGLGTNIGVPLKAICILERGKENRIRKIDAREAVFMLLQQSSRPQNGGRMGKYMELLDILAKNTAFYQLSCNMEPEAARVAYETMSGKGLDSEIFPGK